MRARPRAAFDSERDTEAAVIRKGYGDVEGAFREAHDEVALDLAVGRHTGVPLECRGGVARVDPDTGILELYGATKRAHPQPEPDRRRPSAANPRP